LSFGYGKRSLAGQPPGSGACFPNWVIDRAISDEPTALGRCFGAHINEI
jgi:hypothetical protein